MYGFVIEKFDVNEGAIYPILQESPMDIKTAMNKVLEFALEHPNGVLISGTGHLIEYEVDGAELSCYVDYVDDLV